MYILLSPLATIKGEPYNIIGHIKGRDLHIIYYIIKFSNSVKEKEFYKSLLNLKKTHFLLNNQIFWLNFGIVLLIYLSEVLETPNGNDSGKTTLENYTTSNHALIRGKYP